LNCYFHSDRTGQGQCLGCGKILCSDCMAITGKMRLCSECAVDAHRTFQKQVYTTLGISVVCGIIGIFLFGQGPGGNPVMGAYSGFAVFWGRRFIRDLSYGATSGFWVTWSAFLWIKLFQLFFYMLIGFFTAPIAVAFAFYRLHQSHKSVLTMQQSQTDVTA